MCLLYVNYQQCLLYNSKHDILLHTSTVQGIEFYTNVGKIPRLRLHHHRFLALLHSVQLQRSAAHK
jgi:hypothetical protein